MGIDGPSYDTNHAIYARMALSHALVPLQTLHCTNGWIMN